MNVAWMVAAILLLQPTLLDEQEVRLVVVGTENHPVDWVLRGTIIATTMDGKATNVTLPAGEHDLWLHTDHDGAWSALARPQPTGAEGAVLVPAWTASSSGDEFGFGPTILAAALVAVGILVVMVGRVGPKRP